MNCPEFARAYCPDATSRNAAHWRRTQTTELDTYSALFGQVLHGVLLTGVQQSPPDAIEQYIQNGPSLIAEALETEAVISDENSSRLFVTQAQHAMNWLMLPAWYELGCKPVDKKSPKGIRRMDDLRTAQNGVSIFAGLLYHLREQHVKENPDYLHPDSLCTQRQAVEGVMHELDTAYLGLRYAILHEGVSIVPGPIQFEEFAERGNSDFVIVDSKHHLATGLQVKARVRPDHLSRYDSRRVQLIDGATDLGGERVYRCIQDAASCDHSRHLSVKNIPVSWGGVHSAYHLAREVDPSKSKFQALEGITKNNLLRIQFAVRNSLGNFRPRVGDYEHLSEKIDEGLSKGAKPTPASIYFKRSSSANPKKTQARR